MTLRKLIQNMRQHLQDTSLMLSFVNPPFTIEEQAQGKFNASQLSAQLQGGGAIAELRIASLTATYLYQMRVAGAVASAESARARSHAAKPAPEPPTPAQIATAHELIAAAAAAAAATTEARNG